MARKFWLYISLLCCLATYRHGFSQANPGSGISLDSVIALTTNILNAKMLDQAKIRIDSLVNLISNPNSRMNILMQLKIRNLQGRYLLQIPKNEGWIELYQWCKDNEVLCQSEEEISLLVKLYNNVGIAFKRLDRLSDSKEAYLKSCEALRKLKIPDYILNGSVYANAGNSLKQIGEFERSIEYLTQSIGYFDEYVDKSKTANSLSRIAEQKSKALDNLGLVYQSLADHGKAIEVFNRCIDLKLKFYPKDIINVYGNLVISLIEIDSTVEARQIIEKILNEYESGIPRDRSWALAKLNLIDINSRLANNSGTTIRDLENLNQLIMAELPAARDITVTANQLCINLLIKDKKFPEALGKWSEAVQGLSSEKEEISTDEIPYTLKTVHTNKLIELMNLCGKAYYDWGLQSNDTKKINKAEERFSYALKLIDSLRNSLELQSSKLQVSRMQRFIYDQLIVLQCEMFHRTGDSTCISRLFNTMEQSKSAVLWSSVRDIEFKTSQIPQEDLDKENDLRKNNAILQGKIIEANAALNPDPILIRKLEQENLNFNQQIDSLKQAFREKYPDYYKSKFDRSTITLDQARNLLRKEQVLIEYAMANNDLYKIVVSRLGTTLTQKPVSDNSMKDFDFILEFMKGHTESLTSSARSLYCEAATRLYELLLKDSLSPVLSKEIIIIPDGLLSYIPFEALLEKMPTGTKQDYRRLEYLIRNHAVSYGLTATVFFYKPSRVIKPVSTVLAVAPGYEMNSGKISDYIRKSENGLPQLTGTYGESRAIRKMMGGRLLVGKKATEQMFKKIGPRYSVLHLAMHTIPDKNNSLNSGLIFTPGADHVEDGVLFGYEVYNLSLNAWLTVLSACETGSGQMAGGEGVLSFGRAFIVAGCPNLIMTIWTVDDRSSQEIMIAFYQSLLSGAGIAEALQKSKLSYLEKADQLHAHPHYWAGFIELGQNQILDFPHMRYGIRIVILLSAIAVLALVYFGTKKIPALAGISWKPKSRKL